MPGPLGTHRAVLVVPVAALRLHALSGMHLLGDSTLQLGFSRSSETGLSLTAKAAFAKAVHWRQIIMHWTRRMRSAGGLATPQHASPMSNACMGSTSAAACVWHIQSSTPVLAPSRTV